jgi:hypothetical protein
MTVARSGDEACLWDAETYERVAQLRGHGSMITCARFSPDGTRIVTASADHTARVGDAETGRCVSVLRGHEAKLASARFSADGDLILTQAYDQTARVWDAHTGARGSGRSRT